MRRLPVTTWAGTCLSCPRILRPTWSTRFRLGLSPAPMGHGQAAKPAPGQTTRTWNSNPNHSMRKGRWPIPLFPLLFAYWARPCPRRRIRLRQEDTHFEFRRNGKPSSGEIPGGPGQATTEAQYPGTPPAGMPDPYPNAGLRSPHGGWHCVASYGQNETRVGAAGDGPRNQRLWRRGGTGT
jgi:hypothetical protein